MIIGQLNRLWRLRDLVRRPNILTIAIVSLISINQQGSATCLLIEGQPATGRLDVKSGNFVDLPYWSELAPDLVSSHLYYALSSDGSRVATFNTNGIYPTAPVKPTIQIFHTPVPAAHQDIFYINNGTDNLEASWSPDSRWFVYHWREAKGQETHDYLALADPDGTELKSVEIKTLPGETIQFDSWSADSQYISIIARGQPGTGRIIFWSVPDLHLTDPGIYGQVMVFGCNRSSTLDNFYCATWSTTGHKVAFTIGTKEKPQLVIMSPDVPGAKIFALADSEWHTLKWSPDGVHLAVASFNYNDAYDAQINIFGTDGTKRLNIDNVKESNVAGEGNPYAKMEWTPDGTTLVYAGDSQNSERPVSVKIYSVATGKIQTLLADLAFAELELYPSPDNTEFAVYSYIDGLYLARSNVQWNYRFWNPVFNIAWSPDGSMLAFANSGENVSLNIVKSNGVLVRHFERQVELGIGPNILQWQPCP